eukprot:768585-Hanusia_phi.AAC.1
MVCMFPNNLKDRNSKAESYREVNVTSDDEVAGSVARRLSGAKEAGIGSRQHAEVGRLNNRRREGERSRAEQVSSPGKRRRLGGGGGRGRSRTRRKGGRRRGGQSRGQGSSKKFFRCCDPLESENNGYFNRQMTRIAASVPTDLRPRIPHITAAATSN